MPQFILIRLGWLKNLKGILAPFYPKLPLLVGKISDFFDGNDPDLLNVVIDLVNIKRLFTDLNSLFSVYLSLEKIFELFGSIIRANDFICVLVDYVDLSVCAVENEFFLLFFHYSKLKRSFYYYSSVYNSFAGYD